MINAGLPAKGWGSPQRANSRGSFPLQTSSGAIRNGERTALTVMYVWMFHVVPQKQMCKVRSTDSRSIREWRMVKYPLLRKEQIQNFIQTTWEVEVVSSGWRLLYRYTGESIRKDVPLKKQYGRCVGKRAQVDTWPRLLSQQQAVKLMGLKSPGNLLEPLLRINVWLQVFPAGCENVACNRRNLLRFTLFLDMFPKIGAVVA